MGATINNKEWPRAAQWVRRQLRNLRRRASSLQAHAGHHALVDARRVSALPARSTRPLIDMPDWQVLDDDDDPVPGNRAERRAQDRQQNRQRRTT